MQIFQYRNQDLTFVSDIGVFSKEYIDYGSRVLLESIHLLPSQKSLLDVGCGYGTLGLSLKKVYSWLKVEMIDVNERTLNLAKESACYNQLEDVTIYKSSVYENVKGTFDVIVSNPPIRAGKTIVFEILEQLLDCDLSDFVDEKREDFLIKKESCTLIGEIKGVTSNIKNEHISQVDVHYQGYMGRLQEENLSENMHQLLIMNPFRNKEPSQREPVHEQQIALAERNGCLLIETITLLHIFEKFLAGSISSEQCIAIFSNHTGLLKESDFDLQSAFNPEEFKV